MILFYYLSQKFWKSILTIIMNDDNSVYRIKKFQKNKNWKLWNVDFKNVLIDANFWNYTFDRIKKFVKSFFEKNQKNHQISNWIMKFFFRMNLFFDLNSYIFQFVHFVKINNIEFIIDNMITILIDQNKRINYTKKKFDVVRATKNFRWNSKFKKNNENKKKTKWCKQKKS